LGSPNSREIDEIHLYYRGWQLALLHSSQIAGLIIGLGN
jgi:hypothetical protein